MTSRRWSLLVVVAERGSRRTRTALVLAIVVVGSASALFQLSEETSAYAAHAPIFINGNSNFTSANGVTRGNGTPSDPFIIEGWEIKVTSPSYGIMIWDTDVDFIVRQVYIHSDYGTTQGISLDFSYRGLIVDSVISGGRDGIYAHAASLTVMSCKILDSHYGVYSSNSTNVAILNNSVSGSSEGIVLDHSQRLTIADNTIAGGDIGISLTNTDNGTIATNTFSNLWEGIYLESSDDISVVGNSLSEGLMNGIFLQSNDRSLVTGNDVSNGRYGIYAGDSSGSSISGNSVRSNSQTGVYAYRSSDTVITNNTIEDNAWGLILNESTSVTVYHNDFINNSWQTFDNRIASNRWDDGYPSGGNFWSDYTGPDQFTGPAQDQPGRDGVGDWGYFVSQGASDAYPIVSRHALAYPPDALFTVSPADGQVSTVFTVDASPSSDLKTRSEDLRVRWDWEDDGIWDTAWSVDKAAHHQFSTTGTHQVRLQVRDTDGLVSLTTKGVTVSGDSQGVIDTFWLVAVLLIMVAVIIAILALVLLRGKRRTRARQT